MVALSHKAKHYGWFALKVFILGLAVIFVYQKITAQDASSWRMMLGAMKTNSILSVFLFLVLTAANWFFEIKKWQTVTSVIKNLSFAEAAKQSLSALTVSLATPNRIGDYGAKVFYFEKKHRKKIVLLNFVGNGFQLLCTVFFGIIGLIIVIPKLSVAFSELNLIITLFVILLLAVFGYFFRKREWFIKGFSLRNVWNYFQNIPQAVKLKVMLFSILRYAIFSGLFYLLLRFFGASVSFFEAIAYIASMYFLVSIVPMFLIFDVIVRGSVAVWLFSAINTPDTVVLTTVLAMWLLNFILPAIVGSFHLINLKTQ